MSWPTPGCQPELLRFDHVDDAGDLHATALADSYGCGIDVFRKSLA